ncbi:MAG TPA: hypothetical protein VII94_05980 [Candidatus Saccharimonadales bacterium]
MVKLIDFATEETNIRAGGLMSKLIDLTGQRFGFWLVKNRGANNKSGQVQWLCVCECGKKKNVTSNSLRTGNSTSCGCNHKPNLSGKIFGKLKVLNVYISNDKSRRHWNCQCKCGNTLIVSTYKLRQKITKSCGCDLHHYVNNTIKIGKKLNDLIYDISIKVDDAEKAAIIAKTMSPVNGSLIINQNINNIKLQMKILNSINIELQKNIDTLFRCTEINNSIKN